jgi:hypothetical protein
MPRDAGQYNKRCKFVPFVSPDHQQFLRFFGQLYETNGYKLRQVGSAAGQTFQIERHFLFDAVRFSFKLFAIEVGRKLVAQNSPFA